MPSSRDYLRGLGAALNWARVPKPRRDPPGIRVVRERHVPASALAGAKRPGRSDKIVLRV